MPDHRDELTRDQERFLEDSVAGLAEDGKVICVRLALFAEMVKSKPWTPATLKEVGGAQGLGVSFLEEALGSRSTNPEHRIHQRAVRAVLNALLPEPGTDLKGHVRSHQELLQVSGYARRPKEFDHLMRILDSELRLVTPTDPEGQPADDLEIAADQEPASEAAGGYERPPSEAAGGYGKSYQLTRDYLVPAVRQWLMRKQRETWRGRAALRLEERAHWWSAKPENRQLPAAWEWANIFLFTRHGDWKPSQRQMMRKAGRFHLRQVALVLLLLGLATWGTWWWTNTLKVSALVKTLAWAEIGKVPEIVEDLVPYRRWAEPELRHLAELEDATQRLHARMALVPIDPV